ncbi:PREDICTED: 39S ribosomal protein L34, mitochondrial [Dinoponera quadriceps]|uniref:Large ribosomal subunit protein bL34m n=1 Tax=Dinoponera quadriceps TaxID=609295 RepID=A0A6P3XV28_DINQU|nr:PREDICTED: 39S ribosomal protein L34, mitochondrial [Dinoponera quadriceps]
MMIHKFISGIFQSLPKAGTSSQLCSMFNATPGLWNSWSMTFVRNRMRYHFPHPNERMRIKKHGWYARMATPGGRRILMRRILKGKHVLSH